MDATFPLFVILFMLVAAGVVAYQYYARLRRREAFAAFAATHGFTHYPLDPFGLLDEPFRLFSKGDGRGIENVLDGRWLDVPVRVFDYWYYEESTDSKGGRSRSYHRFDCVLAPIDAACSPLTITRETILTRLADHLAMDDIQFELDEFNRAFDVTGRDRAFATAFCDQRMMRWLLTNAGPCGFEIVGDRLLAFRRKQDVETLPTLLATMCGFRDHVPAVVYSLYPR